MPPNRIRPGRVIGGACDQVDVHLAHDVSNAGDIEFFAFEVVAHELRNLANEEDDFRKLISRKFMEVFNVIVGFGDDEEPGKSRVILEKNPASS